MKTIREGNERSKSRSLGISVVGAIVVRYWALSWPRFPFGPL